MAYSPLATSNTLYQLVRLQYNTKQSNTVNIPPTLTRFMVVLVSSTTTAHPVVHPTGLHAPIVMIVTEDSSQV